MKVAICDDNPYLTEAITKVLMAYDPTRFEVVSFYNPQKLVRQLDEETFAFFILDIEMEDLNGVDLAKIIREKGILSPIVFLTSYKEYMEDVFQVQTFDYLLKPVDVNKFNQVLSKLMAYLEESSNSFVFSINKRIIKIPTQDIVYFEKNKRQVFIHTANQIYAPYLSTTDIKEQIGTDFVQIHSSFIINCAYIKELGNKYILVNEGKETIELPISRRYKEISREQIIMSMRRKMT